MDVEKQLTFAFAAALTKTAKAAQSAVLSEIGKDFKIRNRWTEPGNMFGIKVLPATRGDLTAAIVTRADWLVLHEEGGTKVSVAGDKPKQKAFLSDLGNKHLLGGRHYVAIATSNVRTFDQALPARLKPGRLKKPFVLKMKSGRFGIFIRVGATKKKSGTLKLMYVLVESARIKKASTVVAPTVKTIERDFSNIFFQELKNAIATAK